MIIQESTWFTFVPKLINVAVYKNCTQRRQQDDADYGCGRKQ